MDGPQEYEVESVTRARVHDKKGKKITWKYFVKWKGYGWDESTWEPTDSFQDGSEHILETFWDRVDTGGRDISDAAAFKKGEEFLVSGPPSKKNLKRKASSTKISVAPVSSDPPASNGAAVSAPPPASRKRRHVQVADVDESEYSKRRMSAGGSRTSVRSSKRRRASSPGPRKATLKRVLSPGDSQLDADGETDPDVVEVEDVLMQVSTEDVEEDNAGTRTLATANANGSKKIAFDDLEHFYSGRPIDIDQNADERGVARKSQPSLPPATVQTSDVDTPDVTAVASPSPSDHDPLFDSPPPPSDKAPEKDSALPYHRARAAKPLVKLIDATTAEPTSKQSRITAKARMMFVDGGSAPSSSAHNRSVAKRAGKPGPGRSSSGLLARNRSSLLTVTSGSLKSVKGKYARASLGRDRPDEIEEDATAVRDASEGNKLQVTSWSDDDMANQGDKTTSTSQPGPPTGEQLLELAGLKADSETLPNYEDDDSPTDQEAAKEPQESGTTSAPLTEELPTMSSIELTEEIKAGDGVTDFQSTVATQQASVPATDDLSPSIVAPVVDEVKKNIELAKEHLFPSAPTSFNSFGSTQSSFRSTIFGPLYQGSTGNHVLATKNEFSTTFKVISGDGVELPLLLKDCSELKARISDIPLGSSSGGKVALFYSPQDALPMVSTMKSGGTARIALDTCATPAQQERFSTLLQRFEASQTLVAPAGKEVCVLYSSENADVAERLGAPAHLRGLSQTLLISHASIENQLAYVAAIMKATAV